MVRAKNTAEILTKNVTLYSIACIMSLVIGYAIMYGGSDSSGWLPIFEYLGLGGENTAEDVKNGVDNYSNRSDFFFQVVFVATAMSIVSGAVAERMKLWAFLIFAVVMCGVIYPVQGLWTWGEGWLSEGGYSDFAGSGIVHLAGASAALAGVILLGPRSGKYGPDGKPRALPGCNMPLATLGMFILWFGWFGFNGGSQLHLTSVDDANAVAQVFVNTNIAAAGGLVAALILAKILFGKADLTMALNGALGGLVAITAEPAAGSAFASLAVGIVGGIVVVFSILFFDRVVKIDDPVGAISVHGTCGVIGVLAVIFTNSDSSALWQIIGAVAIFAWVFVASLIVWYILKVTMGIRVSEEEEAAGVDLSETGIEAYPEFVPSN